MHVLSPPYSIVILSLFGTVILKPLMMARIFVTGSSDGIGQHLARALIAQGHSVTLHARNTVRGETAVATVPGAEGILIGDLSSIVDVKALAAEANKTGIFDTVFHNAGVGFRDDYHKSADGLPMEFAVNVLATYLLTALITKSKNLVYMSSGMHSHGDGSLEDVSWSSGRAWDGMQAYSDSK
jgi:NAD(P)-dependent dehydrogenase (short-subunit alcohol dehydrogenase family)